MSKSKSKPTPKREESLLDSHPEVVNNARGYFRHENGKVIVEDRVGRGDQDPWKAGQPMNQSDLTDEDLKGLAVYASDLINPILKKYDERVAIEDAVSRAIGEKDGGKYAGKVNATTSCLIADYVEKKASKEKTGNDSLDYGQSDNSLFVKKTEKKASDYKHVKIAEAEEVKMSRQDEIRALEEKLASLKVEAAKDEMGAVAQKVASDPEARAVFKKLLKEAADKKCEKEDEACEKKASKEKDEKEDEACDMRKSASTHIVEELDKIAADLEAQNDFELFKIAYQIDQISDVIDGRKEASTLEGDVDESFMKKYFKAGKREGDSDEKYMNEFNTDVSKEVSSVVGKKQPKTASVKEPYSVISDHND